MNTQTSAEIGAASDIDSDSDILLQVKNLKRYFRIRVKGGLFGHKADLKAVDDISFTVKN